MNTNNTVSNFHYGIEVINNLLTMTYRDYVII